MGITAVHSTSHADHLVGGGRKGRGKEQAHKWIHGVSEWIRKLKKISDYILELENLFIYWRKGWCSVFACNFRDLRHGNRRSLPVLHTEVLCELCIRGSIYRSPFLCIVICFQCCTSVKCQWIREEALLFYKGGSNSFTFAVLFG